MVHHIVPPIQSLVLLVADTLGSVVIVGDVVSLLIMDGSPGIVVTVGNPIGVQHVVVPASLLETVGAVSLPELGRVTVVVAT
ncbi:unnamed protein product [Somion occarium]|uniref:Secreted protein n=1 Tax=Somion occarium TaxID=3059160 RepID=A0ABP1DNR4_9APHY